MLVPKAGGEITVGATVERAGFEAVNTAAGLNHRIMQAGRELAPDLAGSRFVRAWAELRPGTPDDLPAIGPFSELGVPPIVDTAKPSPDQER